MRAAKNHPDLLAAVRGQEASRYDYRRSWNGLAPSLSLSHGYSDSSGSSTGRWDAQANASWDVFDPAQWASIQNASARYRASQANVQVASADVLLSLYRAFAGMLFAQEQVTVSERLQTIWKANAEMIALRYDSGRESKGNRMKTEAEYLQAQVDVLQSSRDLRVAQQVLGQALGEERFQVLSVTGTWAIVGPPSQQPDLGAMVNEIPLYRLQQAILDQARASIRSAQSAWFPSLSLNYSRGWDGTSEFPQSPFWSLGGRLQYSLFSSGPTATFDAVSAARESLRQSELQTASLRHRLRSDLESAWAGLSQAQDDTRVDQAFLEAARQRRKESDIRYQNGLMAFEQWQLVVIELANSEKNYLRSLQNQLLAEAQWRFVKGEGVGTPQ